MARLYYETFASPIGTLYCITSESHLCYLQPVESTIHLKYLQQFQREMGEICEKTTSLSLKLQYQLSEYFNQQRQTFSIPIQRIGTPFQKEVWQALTTIEYGQTISYKEMAQKVHRPKAYQAVGTAIGKNPILILQPCHRVISLNGSIGGFSAGIERKTHLLTLESTSLRSD